MAAVCERRWGRPREGGHADYVPLCAPHTHTIATPPASFFDYSRANESFTIAASFVYTAPQSSQGSVTQAYLTQGLGIAESQVALAGYRLAALLDSIYATAVAASEAAVKTALRGAAKAA